MKIKSISAAIFVALFCTTSVFAQNDSQPGRITTLFNFDWKFKAGDLNNAQAANFDDKSWRKLDLPHDFQLEQPWNKNASRGRGFKDMGIGWYRKTFKVEQSWKSKQIVLDFEGIMLHGEVWLNGKPIGGTAYGYLGFESDITGLLNFNGDNVVAVRSSTGEMPNSRWYTGGGLFRDVHLIIRDQVAVARHGIFITTPNISADKAEINVQVEVAGIKGKEYNLAITTRIFSPSGKQVAETHTEAPKRSNLAAVEVVLPKVNVSNPQLWDCDNPNLYVAEVSLVLDGKVVDRLRKRFGIRTIAFSKEYGLKLNGRKVFLKGVANHHDLGAVGAAAYETSISRMMDRIKAFGFNHIRTSHNPYSESFFDLADEKGILVVDELYDKWGSTVAWAGSAAWNDLWYKNIAEWIKRDRNHPSVIMWSFGNELQFQEERWGFPTSDWGVTTYQLMNVVAHRYDPTRKTTVAMYPARAGGIIKANPLFNLPENIVPPELATVTDIASFNYCWVDYQQYLKHAPDMIIYQSEAVTNELAAPYFGMDYNKMVGLAYWGGIEYWGESSGWPNKGWNYSFFNHSLEPYPQAYLMKSVFQEKPLVYIGVVDSEAESHMWNDVMVGRKYISAHWNREAGKTYNVYTYTNADEVELFVNGKSIGKQKNPKEVTKRNVIYWPNVPYAAGKITAVASRGGKVIASHELETTGKAIALKIEMENKNWKANGMDLQYLKVYAIDNKGRIVKTAAGNLKFEVSGAASLLALDNGDHASDDLFSGNNKALHKGFAMAILRAGQKAGAVKILVTAKGLHGAKITMNTK